MIVERLSLVNFRIYESVDVALDEGVTAIIGDNGQGKTSLAEAIAYLSTLKSFRGVPADALIRNGCDSAIIRAEVRHADGREVLIEAEISRVGRNRTLVNKQRLQRSRDLLGVLRATVFSPDDLDIVKGAPSLRRDFLDDAAVAIDPVVAETVAEVDRVLRQRNTLLRQAGGRLTNEVSSSLDVWDERFAEHADLTCGRTQQPRRSVQQRGFAAAGRPHEADELALAHFQRRTRHGSGRDTLAAREAAVDGL